MWNSGDLAAIHSTKDPRYNGQMVELIEMASTTGGFMLPDGIYHHQSSGGWVVGFIGIEVDAPMNSGFTRKTRYCVVPERVLRKIPDTKESTKQTESITA